MRRLLGILMLIVGVVGLGYVAMTGTAPRIQSTLAIEAQAVADTAPLGARAQVTGRDVSVTGQVHDHTERAALLARFKGIDGVRVVDISAVQSLPIADPFVLGASFAADGTRRLSGHIPDAASRAVLADAVSVDEANALTVAAGAPDDEFADAAVTGILALGDLVQGDMVLSGLDLIVHGVAADPAALARFNAAFDDLPPAYSLETTIALRDDGMPLRLEITLGDAGVAASGKLPQGFSKTEITDIFAQANTLSVTQAAIPSADLHWPDMARTSIGALNELTSGQLDIDGSSVVLTGQGTPAGIERAQALMSGLRGGFDVTTDLSLRDDGAPLVLTMDWDGSSIRASGKYPAGFNLRGPTATIVTDGGRTSFLPDPDGAFVANANAGVIALGLLTTGRLTSTATDITLTGTATSPQVEPSISSALAQAAAGTTVTRTITYLDDGSPAAFTLGFDAATGATIVGRLPTGLTMAQITDALGVAAVGAPATAFADDNAGSSLDTLSIAATYLREVETLTYVRDGDGSALDLIMQPGVNIDLVAADLAQRLPTDVAFSIGPPDVLPADGTQRTNAATGQREVFIQGFWLPSVDFTPDVAGCTASSNAILADTKITFLSGSAVLDATSIRALNALTAVVRPCVTAGLALEIGGHTDATGDAALNETLSNDRATAVRIALIERGISDRTLTSLGYGQTQPIADDATPRGRAINRRTTFTWFQP